MNAQGARFGLLALLAFTLAAAAPVFDGQSAVSVSDGIAEVRECVLIDGRWQRHRALRYDNPIRGHNKRHIKLRPPSVLTFGSPAPRRAVHNCQSVGRAITNVHRTIRCRYWAGWLRAAR